MFKYIKKKWQQFKNWLSKNKKIIATIVGSFTAGIITTISLSKPYDSKRSIKQLESRLKGYESINNQLRELQQELESRLLESKEDNKQLREQTSQLRKLNNSARLNIDESRKEIDRVRESIESGIENSEAMGNEINRIREQSERIDNGIKKLKEWVEKEGLSNIEI